jgi:hypothetical protein
MTRNVNSVRYLEYLSSDSLSNTYEPGRHNGSGIVDSLFLRGERAAVFLLLFVSTFQKEGTIVWVP